MADQDSNEPASCVDIAGLPTDALILQGSNRRSSKGSPSGSLAGISKLEKSEKSWIAGNFQRRECIKIVKDGKKTTSEENPVCKCGRTKLDHDATVAREDTSDQWTPERCTRLLPTDAYGEIEFLGQGKQTKRSPVSDFVVILILNRALQC
ncbi:hypothetical protein ACROYT_G011205 [Oculina patagonica]